MNQPKKEKNSTNQPKKEKVELKKSEELIINPVWGQLESELGLDFAYCSANLFSQYIDSIEDFYHILQLEGYFLPTLKHFTLDWAKLWLAGKKKFLKNTQIIDCRPIWRPQITWETLDALMNLNNVRIYFYVEDDCRPDFEYIYKVLYTVLSEFREIQMKFQKKSVSNIIISKENLAWLQKLPQKDPIAKGYKKFCTNKEIPIPKEGEFDEFFKKLDKDSRFTEEDKNSIKVGLICKETNEKIKDIVENEKTLFGLGALTPASQIAPLLSVLAQPSSEKIDKFAKSLKEPGEWALLHEKNNDISTNVYELMGIKDLPKKLKHFKTLKEENVEIKDLLRLEKIKQNSKEQLMDDTISNKRELNPAVQQLVDLQSQYGPVKDVGDYLPKNIMKRRRNEIEEELDFNIGDLPKLNNKGNIVFDLSSPNQKIFSEFGDKGNKKIKPNEMSATSSALQILETGN